MLLYSMQLYDRYGKLDFFLFDFIFDLLNVFKVMINIVKTELINATENRLENILCYNFFLLAGLFPIFPFPFGQDQVGLDIDKNIV